MRHAYHYYATIRVGSKDIRLDGIAKTSKKVLNIEEYKQLKTDIAESATGMSLDPKDLTVVSLDYLGEASS